jgi:CRP-like cAMP-binding protein
LKAGEDTAIRIRSHYQREFAPGQLVVGAGERADHLFVIQSGEIELSREGPGGQRGAARLGPGDFFGELGVVLGERVPTRAIAVKPTRVLQLDRETLEAMCLAQPEIAIRMIRVLVSRLIEAERRLAALGAEPAGSLARASRAARGGSGGGRAHSHHAAQALGRSGSDAARDAPCPAPAARPQADPAGRRLPDRAGPRGIVGLSRRSRLSPAAASLAPRD